MDKIRPFLYVVRGLPGAGKSTFARKLVEKHLADVYFEADMFFIGPDGKYHWTADKIKQAHKWCQDQVFKALSENKRVAVSNTFTKISLMYPYLDFCTENNIEYEVIRITSQFKNIHNVPEDVLKRMKQNLQPYPGEILIK